MNKYIKNTFSLHLSLIKMLLNFTLKLKITGLKSYLNCCPYTTLNFKLYENISVLFSLFSVSSPAVVRDYRLQGCLVFLLSNLLPPVPLFSVPSISPVCLSLPVFCLSVTLSPPAVVHTLFLKKICLQYG